MRVRENNIANGRTSRNSRWGGLLSIKWKFDCSHALDGGKWEVAGHATQGAVTKIIKHAKASAQHSAPVGPVSKVIGNSYTRRKISVGCVVKRSATRCEGDRCRIAQPDNRKGIVLRILALQSWIDVPAQSIGHC